MKTASRLGAASLAALLHLGIILIVGLSLERTKFHFEVHGGGGAILASLTPAGALAAAARSTTTPIDRLAQTLRDATTPAPDISPSTPNGSNLLAELDEPSSSSLSATAAPNPRSTATASNDSSAAKLGAADNPWAHASATTLNTTRVRELWTAIKPCWRGHVDEAAASIRVVLGARGEVVAMTALGDLGPTRSAAEALALAVSACAPYRVAADAYLVSGPV